MKAAVLTIAGVQKHDRYEDAFYILDDQQEATVRQEIQQRQLADTGILIVIEGYASLQGIGIHDILLKDVIQTEASGNNPNTEWLNREVIYYNGRGILGLRVVYTTNPLKRIVYDITTEGNIQVAHV